MRRKLLRLGAAVLLALVLAVGGGYLWLKWEIGSAGPLERETVVVIPKGTGAAEIGELLAERGVIRQPLMLRAAQLLSSSRRPLRAGEYEFPPAVSVADVVTLLQNGRTVVRRFTVFEGQTVAEVLALVEKLDGLEGAITERPDEGTLLPETYFYTYGDSRDAMIRRMRQAMEDVLEELWPKRQADLPIATRREALTLASIIEKETGVAAERARVAGVFVNRLRRGWRLESDPTVVYGITRGEKPLGRELTRTDTRTATPYNTYVAYGLPPGPIANPGRASIEAALNPADTRDLFFVADGTGGHAFAETFDDHIRNVLAWRRLMRERSEKK